MTNLQKALLFVPGGSSNVHFCKWKKELSYYPEDFSSLSQISHDVFVSIYDQYYHKQEEFIQELADSIAYAAAIAANHPCIKD